MLTQPETPQEPVVNRIIRLLRWDKPAGRLILMIPALWAIFMASMGKPPLPLVVVIIIGTLATSAAGCVVNDLWDRNIDPQVERTKNRPLAARSLSVQVGIVVLVVAMVCAAGLAFYLNPLANPLAFWLCVAAVPVILLYPGAKRVFPVPQLILSMAWGFAVLISWSAVTRSLSLPTWLLWGATVMWTLGFDTVYAMSDREDDRRIGVNSSALFFGEYVVAAIACFYLSTIILLAALGFVTHLHFGFWLGFLVAICGWSWQIYQLSQPEIPSSTYSRIFGQNVWIGFILLVGMEIGLLF
ncbi:4-hydroxybenzoate solanesyltransferase [Calothrix sp. NIES-3974]|uniref:4-hydroxybenzoate solanesyltransferase n=1 Tax=Calothrix sp. NIES-3974 TaxID=2005462 RepID=UPI000B6174E8|nr:4-hydroxybenzoate solanesyltransferase [Calothrix sp. NIES-3974]BAZ03379.1 4-hydroxybenzoate polyprenyl transferase [Calothrix sp. NIES-3974]